MGTTPKESGVGVSKSKFRPIPDSQFRHPYRAFFLGSKTCQIPEYGVVDIFIGKEFWESRVEKNQGVGSHSQTEIRSTNSQALCGPICKLKSNILQSTHNTLIQHLKKYTASQMTKFGPKRGPISRMINELYFEPSTPRPPFYVISSA